MIIILLVIINYSPIAFDFSYMKSRPSTISMTITTTKVISYKTSGFGEFIKNKNELIYLINDYLEMIA